MTVPEKTSQIAVDDDNVDHAADAVSAGKGLTETDTTNAMEALHNEDTALNAALEATRKTQESASDTWEVVTDKDGLVRKRVTIQGTGDLPSIHSTCLVHYVGKLKDSDEVFMNTREEGKGEPVMLVAGRAHVLRERCLHMTVATMRVGETCIMESDPVHGYGKIGNFSFPSVPPNASLVYEMELLGFSPPEEKQVRDMFFEERLEAAQRRRKEANAVFQEGKFKEALGMYLMALNCVNEDFMMQLEGFFLEQAEKVKAPLHLNMAACQLQLEDWNTAIHNCGEVLKLTPPDEVDMRCKALFRRAKARTQLGQTDEALRDMCSALLLSPNDPKLLAETQRLKGVRKQELKAVDNLFKDKLKAGFAPASSEGLHHRAEGNEAASTSGGPSAATDAQDRGWNSTMDKPSVGEQAFNWFADTIVAFVTSILRRWFGIQLTPAGKWERQPAAPPGKCD